MVKIFKSILAWRGVVAKRYERYAKICKDMKTYEKIWKDMKRKQEYVGREPFDTHLYNTSMPWLYDNMSQWPVIINVYVIHEANQSVYKQYYLPVRPRNHQQSNTNGAHGMWMIAKVKKWIETWSEKEPGMTAIQNNGLAEWKNC